jgi:hypothetical protein
MDFFLRSIANSRDGAVIFLGTVADKEKKVTEG